MGLLKDLRLLKEVIKINDKEEEKDVENEVKALQKQEEEIRKERNSFEKNIITSKKTTTNSGKAIKKETKTKKVKEVEEDLER